MTEFGRRIDSDARLVSLSLTPNSAITDRWLRAAAPHGALLALAQDAQDLVGALPDEPAAEGLMRWCQSASERGLWHDWWLSNHRDVITASLLIQANEMDEREADDPSGSHFIVRHTQPLKSRNLTIAVDATWLGPHQTGAQVLTTAAVEALAKDDRVSRIQLTGISSLPEYAAHLVQLDKVSLEPNAVEQADIAWYPNQIDGRSNIEQARNLGRRVVTTYLDLIAYDIPRYHASAEAWAAYRSMQRRIALSVDGVTTISADVAERLQQEVPRLESDRVRPIVLGLDHITATSAPAEPDADLAELIPALGDRRFVLVLGNDFVHKNRDLAIAIWQQVLAAGESCDLVLAGLHVKSSSSKAAEDALLAKHVDLRGRVHAVDHVTAGSRAWLLANADAVLYPSSAEGFGFVPYEAAALGTPSSFAGFGPLAEVSGVMSVPRHWTVQDFAEDLTLLLGNPAAAELRLSQLRGAIERHTWRGFAEQLVDFFQHIIGMQTVFTSTVSSTASADAALAAIMSSKSYRATQRLRTVVGRLRRG
ncbi:MAG: glycosyltransferase [Actinomycetota bacterium]|nr:glycosyltransferase [Actinomycetota bacterium]